VGFQVSADAGDRPARPDAADERPDPATALIEDHRPGGRLVNERDGRVGELLGQEPASLPRRARFWKLSGEDGGALGTMMTSDLTAARAARLSADIFSGITQTGR
jgi:hypothetical protein